MILEYARNWNREGGNFHTDIAHDEDGVRYFKENGRWMKNGETAKRWRALLSQFRRSDWGGRNGFHLSGCPLNQYLVAECSEACHVLKDEIYKLGGFPKDFNPGSDERNEHRSSVETYG